MTTDTRFVDTSKTPQAILPVLPDILAMAGETSCFAVCKAWKRATPQAYEKILTAYQNDPIIQRFLPRRRIAKLSKKERRHQAPAIVQKTYKRILTGFQRIDPSIRSLPSLNLRSAIEDLNLVRFFKAISRDYKKEFSFPEDLTKGNIFEKASAIRLWMANNSQLLAQVKHLRCSRLDLYTLPPEIRYFTNLSSLYLRDNKLTRLCPEIRNLVHLKRLYLDGNRLISLQEIDSLHNLTALYATENRFISLQGIESLTNLEELDLSANYLLSIPKSIGNLKKLRRLFFPESLVTTLPEEIGNLPALELVTAE